MLKIQIFTACKTSYLIWAGRKIMNETTSGKKDEPLENSTLRSDRIMKSSFHQGKIHTWKDRAIWGEK
jgi:hypothetical protein